MRDAAAEARDAMSECIRSCQDVETISQTRYAGKVQSKNTAHSYLRLGEQ